MTEAKTAPNPDTLIQDSKLAENMAIAEKRHRDYVFTDGERLGELATAAILRVADEDSELEAERYKQEHSTGLLSEEDKNNSAEGEDELTHEQLRRIIEGSDSVISVWISAKDLAEKRKLGVQDAFNTFYSGDQSYLTNKLAQKLQSPQFTEASIKEGLEAFDKAEVSELLTFLEVPAGLASKYEEKLCLLRYDTVTRTASHRYDYEDGRGRTGNQFNYALILKEEEAVELLEEIKNNPQIAREIGELLMQERVGVPEAWDTFRPPYDDWKAVNGGINRIALRTGYNAGQDEYEILEF